MASSLFPQSNNQQMSNNPFALLKQFNEFKKQMQGKDPKAMVMQLVNDGKISKEQLNQAQEMAKQFEVFLK